MSIHYVSFIEQHSDNKLFEWNPEIDNFYS